MVGAEMVNQSDEFVSRNEIARAFPKAVNDSEVMTAAVLDVVFDLVLHSRWRLPRRVSGLMMTWLCRGRIGPTSPHMRLQRSAPSRYSARCEGQIRLRYR